MAIEIGSLNTKGPTGDRGPKGATGDSGSVWLTGVGKPASKLGVDLDMYIDRKTADVYQKQNDKWVFKLNIEGPKGQDGKAGKAGAVVWSSTNTETTTGGGGGAATQAPKLIETFDTDISTGIGSLVVVNGSNSVTKIVDNLIASIPNGIFGIGIAKPTTTTIDVQFIGIVPGYSGFTTGLPLFVSITGTLSHAIPATGVIQQIGFAVGSGSVFMNLMQAIQRA